MTVAQYRIITNGRFYAVQSYWPDRCKENQTGVVWVTEGTYASLFEAVQIRGQLESRYGGEWREVSRDEQLAAI